MKITFFRWNGTTYVMQASDYHLDRLTVDRGIVQVFMSPASETSVPVNPATLIPNAAIKPK